MLSDGFKTERPGCQDYADALADFLNALKLTRVNLLGNSFGSRVVQCFAMHYPARINKMIFVGASAGRKGMTEQEKAQLMASRKEQIGQGGYNFPDKIVKALLNSKATPELIELTSYALRAVDPRGFMHGTYFGVAEGYSPEEVGAKVTSPLLLISGDEDRISPLATNAEPLHKAIRGSRLEILKGIGHLPHVEAPDKVNQMAREFFGGNPPESREEQAKREVTQKEKEWREAWVRGDAATLDRLHADDYFSINNIGQRSTKAQVMADVRAGLFKYESMEHKDVVLRVYSDVVIVNGQTINKGRRDERDVSGEFSFTRVYVKRNRHWQAVLAQYTRSATK
jgi:pimeloyl-ACP methyl ester carboxylesterase/ketosteroid isomerase-like protein